MTTWAIFTADRKVCRIETYDGQPAELGDCAATEVAGEWANPWSSKPAGDYYLRALEEGGLAWVYAGSLLDRQNEKWEAIKAARDAAEVAPITWNGSVFDGDAVSRTRLCDAAMLASFALAAGSTYEVEWTLADNSTRLLSAADLMAIVVQGGTDVEVAFETARILREQLNAATTMAEIEAINWPT